jgi:SAM-dependent methyltransferase
MSTAAADCVACSAPLELSPWVRLPYWALHQCRQCRSLSALPRPTSGDQEGLHSGAKYFEHPYFDARRRSSLVEKRCRETFERLYEDQLSSLKRGLRHLDVGCDTGEFLLAAQRLFNVIPTGLEIAPLSADVARGQGIKVYLTSAENLPEHAGPFDIITAIDLVEHLVLPEEFFLSARNVLSDHGLLYVETPNPASLVYRLARLLTNFGSGRPEWICQRIFLHEHIQYFTKEGLLASARKVGLRPVKLETRRLPSHDVSAGLAVRTALSAVQLLDRPGAGSGILTWGVFARL